MSPEKITHLNLESRFWSKVDYSDSEGCWNWKQSLDPSGYGRIWIKDRNGKMKCQRSSIVVWEMVYGAIPKRKGKELVCVLHACDNPKCVNFTHLSLGTNQDNTDDMIKKKRDRKARGEDAGRAILNEMQVRVIRRAQPLGVSYAKLGKMFGLSKVNAYKAGAGLTWKHLNK